MKCMQATRFVGRNILLAFFTVLLVAGAVDSQAGGDADAASEVEADNRFDTAALDMPVEVLRLQIKHLSVDELTEEADRWYAILRLIIRQLSEEKIEVWFENEKLAKVQVKASETPASRQEAANLIVGSL